MNIIDITLNTLRFLLLTVPLIAVASYLVSYSINRGIMNSISIKIEPFLRRLGLNQIIIASIAVCFISPIASYSILSQALREGKISEREVIATTFLNSFPATFSHVYSFFIPFVIPVLGWTGFVYMCIRIIVSVVKSFIGYVLALRIRDREYAIREEVRVERYSSLKSLLKTLKSVIPLLAITYLTVNLAFSYGIFENVERILSFLPFDPNVVTVAVTEFVNVRVAIVLSAGLIENGILSQKWTLIALILGNIITLSARSFKHSLPLHISLFGKFGLKLVALNSAVTFLLDLLVIFILLVFF